MSLDISHKPNYFLFAQLLVRFIETHPPTHPTTQLQIPLSQLQEIFQGDAAATSINLEGILNIANEYKVETLSGDKKLIQSYEIDNEQLNLVLDLNAQAISEMIQGKALIAPDASLQE
ncbi:hypothetical protein [Acinetobacter sp. MB5]|uniref:hypothetical protein n=1 Tax=Acinetobacter sp. MB5 TaxID=2069438 RepID=UPI000DCFBACD|nr:hypothetical protein [Acinetobacter sp. MB5]